MERLPLCSLLPEVVAVARGRRILAAGSIIDGRGLAAVLCLGAAGALIGTRSLATPEAPASEAHKRAILDSSGPDATIASTIIDIIWDDAWAVVQVRSNYTIVCATAIVARP